ncbi:hypothetical protein OKW38_001954 [Paraburkholderia sp. MM5496-R1]|uniref:hypothetical protein n=1 Tax=Paraburkholderia sp. MM5496-R1 TaxID=2991065 RepID=UPI003D19EB32
MTYRFHIPVARLSIYRVDLRQWDWYFHPVFTCWFVLMDLSLPFAAPGKVWKAAMADTMPTAGCGDQYSYYRVSDAQGFKASR